MTAYVTTLLLTALLFVRCMASADSTLSYKEITGLPQRIDWLSAWLVRPKQRPDVQPLLPEARPTQPWPYRQLDSAAAYSVSITDTHAVVATVTHAPVPGITSDMMRWWFQEGIYGRSSYSEDESAAVWDNYIRWHPQQHIYQRVKRPADNGSETDDSAEAEAADTAQERRPQHPKSLMLWEICEYITSADPTGYTTANYPGPEATEKEYFIKAIAEVRQLDEEGLWVTVPTWTGLGPTFWNLKHEWQDTPAGLAINSTQVVGVVDPAWRPIWFARLRNAIPRGLFSQGRDPTWMLSQWVEHCVEEIGNLEHILPGLYRPASAERLADGGSSNKGCHNHRSDEGPGGLTAEL
eukprot:GHUV01000909.1.p1 GENE.GHUV01000909.1~~GHUV01000909.1.p1  ORF type:complete len:352 (+),score=47.35 GHUV01000909.1:97-1152(+)